MSDTESIKSGKYVEMVYDLYEVVADGDDRLVHQVDENDPEKIVYGVTKGVILPLEKALEGLKPGDKFDVSIKADEAFGPHDPQQVAVLERDIFEVDGKFDGEHVKVGAHLPMMTADGYRIDGVVMSVNDHEVVMDFNHPLAGKDVRFVGHVGVVRDATPEEIHPAHGCCGCGDSCGCDGKDADAQQCGGGCCGGCN